MSNVLINFSKEKSSTINRGAVDLFQLVVYFGVTALLLAGVVIYASSLSGKTNDAEEYQNANTLLSNARSYLKQQGIYDYASAAEMTSTLVNFGGAPSSMGKDGTIKNTWGGAVTLAPTTSGGAAKAAFILTYEKVPYEACIALATKVSEAPNVVTTKINGTATNGVVKASAVSSQCTKDSGGAGANSVAFTTNN
ncbi:type 4 pilus major pilin [Hafnia paralvei]|uniref:type 4 pilus major pilin n=1 Tax=Hafnia paralvei TaxID=546367 RepID=UPI002FDC418F